MKHCMIVHTQRCKETSLSKIVHFESILYRRTFDGDFEEVASVALDVEEGAGLLGGAELEVDVAAVAHVERRQVDGGVGQAERHRVVEDGCKGEYGTSPCCRRWL